MKCPLCNNIKKNELLIVEELFIPTHKKFEYVLCRNCESLSIIKIPEDLEFYYSNYYSFKEQNIKNNFIYKLIKKNIISKSGFFIEKISNLLSKNENYRIRCLAHIEIKPNYKLLDVGCGSGVFVRELNELCGLETLGIDEYLSNDKNPKKNRCLKKSIFEIKDYYNIITFHHSLEHFIDISKIFQKISEILLSEGTCIIRMPNINSEGFKQFKENWFSIHPPYHLNLPSFKIMEYLSKKFGMYIHKIIGEENPEFTAINIGFQRGMSLNEIFSNNQIFQKKLTSKLSSNFSKKDLKNIYKFYEFAKKDALKSNWIVYYIKKKKY